MRFSVNKIVLWPKKSGLKYRTIDFEEDKVNIITGASRTGKSALIPIIDYCLGSDKCTIPVDTIRKACSWFGVLFNLDGEQLLLCRREPGRQMSTGEMYFERNKSIEIPSELESNINCGQVKNILNELFSMSFLDIDPNLGNFSSRPSYRDFMAFIFQPQNIVANADVLFYKADTMEHKQKLINVFPYALGAVTPEVLAARQELDRLRKQKERVQRDIDTIKDVSETWKQEIAGWISQAKELGLTDVVLEENLTFEEQVAQLSLISKKTENDSVLVASNIKNLSEELTQLRKEEQNISSVLFALQKRHTEMIQLKDSIQQYETSLQVQLQRLEISNWLLSLADEDDVCPFCFGKHTDGKSKLSKLCDAISEIEKSTGDLNSIPAAFERELQNVESEISVQTERLNALRRRIREESGKKLQSTEKKYTLSSISRFLGRVDATLETFDKIGKDSELEEQLTNLIKRINELSEKVDEQEIKRKQAAAISYINQRIGENVLCLDAEHPEDPVEFIIKDLTLKVKKPDGRDDYLWEIGSASNWLAYHVATVLSLQQYFQTKGKVSVPNFIIFDQPSQVYFPQSVRNKVENDNKFITNDEDKLAVKKIFEMMAKYIKQINNSVQIIITEHADEDIWGDIEGVHLVERWRGPKNKLVPIEWLD